MPPAHPHRAPAERIIVHIGVGAFHRAHQAVYLDDLAGERPGWRIRGVGLMPQDRAVHDALTAQDCLYTVVELSGAARRTRTIGSLLDHLYAPRQAIAVLDALAAPECRIVSLTITESAYRADPREPASWLGCLAESLARRRAAGLGPFAVLSCDNLQHNGEVARKAVLAGCELRDPSLARWVADHGAFPNTMVDRITPVTTEEHRGMIAREFGITDACPVVTEPFRQWVIEDHFPQGRPPWELAGALMTSDVAPYEKIKIRLLNAGHQALCYTGMLLGYESVHEAIADPRIASHVRRQMDDEVTPLLPEVPGIDLTEYKMTLFGRFANSAIGDRLSRIAADASTRIAQHVLPSATEQATRGGPMRALALTIAAWFRWIATQSELDDPLSAKLLAAARRGGPDPAPLLAIEEVFERSLAAHPAFRAHVSEALRSLYDGGPAATLAAYQQQ